MSIICVVRRHYSCITIDALKRRSMTHGVYLSNPWRLTRIAGEPERALEIIEANMRLDPFPRLISTSNIMAVANYMLNRYGEAVRLARECTSRLPNVQAPHLLLGSAYARLGQLEEARKETAEVLRINPGFTIERFKPLAVYKSSEDFEHRLDGLRNAG